MNDIENLNVNWTKCGIALVIALLVFGLTLLITINARWTYQARLNAENPKPYTTIEVWCNGSRSTYKLNYYDVINQNGITIKMVPNE